MRTKLSLILGGLLLLNQSAMAQTVLTVSASIPSATGLALTITPVTNTGTGGAPVFGTPITGSAIPFGTLAYNSTNGIWTSPTYYAVNIGTTGGSGTPVVDVTYTEGTGSNCPNIAAGLSSSLGCLGTKTTATFDAVSSTSDTPVVGPVPLITLTGTTGQLSASQIPAGDFERVYVGIWNGPNPTNGKPFTNADAPGTYTGTLTFTATTL